jgi:predicted DNA-binding transcriptional regulator AlpA
MQSRSPSPAGPSLGRYVFFGELCELLGVGERTGRLWLAEGGRLPPHFKIGRRLAWKRAVVEEFLREIESKTSPTGRAG